MQPLLTPGLPVPSHEADPAGSPITQRMMRLSRCGPGALVNLSPSPSEHVSNSDTGKGHCLRLGVITATTKMNNSS